MQSSLRLVDDTVLTASDQLTRVYKFDTILKKGNLKLRGMFFEQPVADFFLDRNAAWVLTTL